MLLVARLLIYAECHPRLFTEMLYLRFEFYKGAWVNTLWRERERVYYVYNIYTAAVYKKQERCLVVPLRSM